MKFYEAKISKVKSKKVKGKSENNKVITRINLNLFLFCYN